MRYLILRLNYLPIFDTERWPLREFLSRFFGVAAVLAVCIRTVLANKDYINNVLLKQSTFFVPLWQKVTGSASAPAESSLPITHEGGLSMNYYDFRLLAFALTLAIFLGYIIAFLTRSDTKSAPRGFMEVVFPFIIAGIPFSFGMFRPTFDIWCPATVSLGFMTLSKTHILLILMSISALGALLNLIGLLTLRRGFTIMTDARALITAGPFRFVRHPLYAGHFLEFFGIMMLVFNYYTAALYVIFIAGQYVRARNEEKKLALVFPEYEDYKSRTGMFFPKLFRGKKADKPTAEIS